MKNGSKYHSFQRLDQYAPDGSNRQRDGQEDNTRGINLRQIKFSRGTVITEEASIEKWAQQAAAADVCPPGTQLG